MNVMPRSKEEELLLRIFKRIKKSHFDLQDQHWSFRKFKCFRENVQLENNLIEDVANFIQNRFPEFYHSQRRKLEAYSNYLSKTKSE